MELVILLPTLDSLRDFHKAPPFWISLNAIIELSYLQQISLSVGDLSWQDSLAFEGVEQGQGKGWSEITMREIIFEGLKGHVASAENPAAQFPQISPQISLDYH
jgi:hypothetical protein